MDSVCNCFSKIFLFLIFYSLILSCEARKHHLTLMNDDRVLFSVSVFGFFEEGKLNVTVDKLVIDTSDEAKYGFSLTRTVSGSITPYLENRPEKCFLWDNNLDHDENVDALSILIDPKLNTSSISCSKNFEYMSLSVDPGWTPKFSLDKPDLRQRRSSRSLAPSDNYLLYRAKRQAAEDKPETQPVAQAGPQPEAKKTEVVAETTTSQEVAKTTADKAKEEEVAKRQKCSDSKVPVHCVFEGPVATCSFQFQVFMLDESYRGLYRLYFHNCHGLPMNLSMHLVEENYDSYLSAGEIFLPRVYFLMAVIFCVLGIIWFIVLRKKREEVFKIHYLMGVLVIVKSMSLMFHGFNYYFIAIEGNHIEAWAVLYYITHLLKGALLFITLVLIGAGWAFIKHILSDRDKKIFMVVIPLQVLATVAQIIMEESEEGDSKHNIWGDIFTLVDLLCCGAILFPVVWSIRHLQEASHTDGKAAINLEKLKLFRHFYVMIVCYIYSTRIIVYLLRITVPFQYEYMDELFREVATLGFFLMTGYKFRPAASNPYFRLSQEEEEEMEEVLTQTGFTEGVTKVLKSRETKTKEDGSTVTRRESSHEYD